jgi:hypothetical protein
MERLKMKNRLIGKMKIVIFTTSDKNAYLQETFIHA